MLHLYDLLAVELAEPGYRGSPFANACVELGAEHPAAAVAREHRQWLLDTFTGLAAETAGVRSGRLGGAAPAALRSRDCSRATPHGDAARPARPGPPPKRPPADPRRPPREPGHPHPARSTDGLTMPAGGSPEAHRLVAFLNSAHLPDGDDQLADERAGPWLAAWLADARRPAPAALAVARDGRRTC